MNVLFVGVHVTTPKGTGVITRIEPVVHWAFREPIRDSEIVVKLDDKPDAHVRPVFLASSGQVKPVDADYSSRAENQAEARAVEDDQFRRHGDPED